jgi:hypothetical protein
MKMKRMTTGGGLVPPRIIQVIATVLLCAAVVAATPAHAAPTIARNTLIIGTYRNTGYWRDKNADSPEWGTWSWYPRITFRLIGPVTGGSQMYADFTMPDGKPWMSIELSTPELAEGEWSAIEARTSRDDLEKMAILSTGVFGYKIRIKNELTGTDEVLMQGKFKVNKFHKGLASEKNAFEYYVDEDWRLPIGWVTLDDNEDNNAPPLNLYMWLRGDEWKSSEVAGYLLKDGNQIWSTKKGYSSATPETEIQTMADDKGDPKWALWRFTFYVIRAYNKSGTTMGEEVMFLDQNPGTYEFKVMYGGKVVRSATFSVNPDGTLVDNGIAGKNNLGTSLVVLPVKVIGNVDGTWDANAYKTDAFYGNPLTGFTAP